MLGAQASTKICTKYFLCYPEDKMYLLQLLVSSSPGIKLLETGFMTFVCMTKALLKDDVNVNNYDGCDKNNSY